MGGDDELRKILHEVMQPHEHGKLPLRRERGLRLVEEIHAMTAHAVRHGRQEGFAVRLLVKAFATVAPGAAFFDIKQRGKIVEALRSQKEAVHRAIDGAADSQTARERRGVLADGHVCVLGAAFDVETEFFRDGFQQRRFAGTILSDEKRDFGMQF